MTDLVMGREALAAQAVLSRQDPEVFLNKQLGITKIWEGQRQILQALTAHPRISVRSGHSLGKDYISSAAMLWFLLAHIPSIVIATAPTDRQAENVIWGELTAKYLNAPNKLGGRLLVKHLEMDKALRWYCMAFTTKEANNTTGKFQGFHQRHVFILFSEAQAIERPIWDQAESLMASGHCIWLAIGNPLINYGAFYETFSPNSGWHNIHLNCEDNPNYIEGREVIPGLASREWVKQLEKKHGRTSIFYMTKALGEFPPRTDHGFVEPAWLEWANGKGLAAIEPEGEEVAGCDPASLPTKGETEDMEGRSDKTVITVRKGMAVTKTLKFERKSTMETVGELVKLLNDGVAMIYLDVTGIGTGIYHRLVELGMGERVVPVNFGSTPNDDYKDEDGLLPTQKYVNMAAQMYDNVAALLEFRKMGMEYDEDRNMQLLNRKMFTASNGKKVLESKKEYKKRGFTSPDEADSLVLAFAGSRHAVGVVAKPFTETTEDPTLRGMFGGGEENDDE